MQFSLLPACLLRWCGCLKFLFVTSTPNSHGARTFSRLEKPLENIMWWVEDRRPTTTQCKYIEFTLLHYNRIPYTNMRFTLMSQKRWTFEISKAYKSISRPRMTLKLKKIPRPRGSAEYPFAVRSVFAFGHRCSLLCDARAKALRSSRFAKARSWMGKKSGENKNCSDRT